MTIQDKPIEIGQMLFFPRESASGNVNWKEGEVREINEHVKAVKLLYAVGSKAQPRGKTEWFPVSSLQLTDPRLKPATP